MLGKGSSSDLWPGLICVVVCCPVVSISGFCVEGRGLGRSLALDILVEME
jgi:hypothetical protein